MGWRNAGNVGAGSADKGSADPRKAEAGHADAGQADVRPAGAGRVDAGRAGVGKAGKVGAAIAVLALVLAGAGCTGTRPDRAAPDPTESGTPDELRPGAAGIGDPYFPKYGNGGYDVSHYKLKIKYDPATDQLTGVTTIKATATTGLSRFNLDLAGLTVRSATVDGKPAKHQRDNDELILTPATGVARGKAFTAEITYDGVPGERSRPGLGATGFLHTTDGAFAVGQPESAATWYPVNDHPLDKATYTIEITAPESLSALSNGVLTGTTKADGWATSTWEVRQPMASYLSTVAIGNYRVKTGSHRGKPIVTAVATSLSPGPADVAMDRTGEVVDFLETRFGPYPFDAYGGIVVDDDRIGFALETQTRPVYSAKFFVGEKATVDGTWVVSHELAHQWFGDSVSVQHWGDIWLNEGFATYAQWLWDAHTNKTTEQSLFDEQYETSEAKVWATPPADPGAGEIFSRSVYQRGAMALHALRLAVGDDAFFRIVKAWSAQKRNGNATTAEFMTVAERVSGKSLRPLFDAWLYGKSKPPRPTGG